MKPFQVLVVLLIALSLGSCQQYRMWDMGNNEFKRDRFLGSGYVKKSFYENGTVEHKKRLKEKGLMFKSKVKSYYPSGQLQMKMDFIAGRGFGASVEYVRFKRYSEEGKLASSGLFEGVNSSYITSYNSTTLSDTCYYKYYREFREASWLISELPQR